MRHKIIEATSANIHIKWLKTFWTPMLGITSRGGSMVVDLQEARELHIMLGQILGEEGEL